ncbi:hypothetical protein, partial [Mycobacterium tuberculosis]
TAAQDAAEQLALVPHHLPTSN